jgi:hypothetical protein
LIQHGPHRKRRLQQFFVAAGKYLPSCYLATIGEYTSRPTESPSIRHESHRKRRVQQLFVAAGTCLPSRCLAALGGIQLTKPFPCNERSDTHTDIHAADMGSVGMVHIPSFIQHGLGIQRLIGWGRDS